MPIGESPITIRNARMPKSSRSRSVQSYFGCASLKRAYLLVKANDPRAFSHLPGYKQWLARWHQLSFQMDVILENIPLKITDSEEIYLIDSFPIPMCQAIRHPKRQFAQRSGSGIRERDAQVGFSGSNCTFYQRGRGKLSERCCCRPVMMTAPGARMLASLMTEGSLCLADPGYRGTAFQTEMYEEEGVLFLTRADIESQKLKILHSTIRERVEGIFSSLWERFATRVYSRSWHGLWNTLKLKMLDYKLCFANLISYA